ncbi:gliding motility-associated C-terminal domain-containing protein [Flavobacterium sp. MC2016-06]|jgi:gliding motility-associated-like protein|uniref:gliding motility-associated C-terminal domain-containing protein n=1 Tax=Flavobacterium sp. MC2016-06 TaxID=2676308 RepID=UPI0012BACE25|nr:gliding motility-associated C-terminal domain-containing protein [Flavobacterium sp. MC2016-06]MBU3862479.1 gliding motility-associated C-terminal domain-containing protein [Flavobacterium sp. MC2016-06]
MKKKNLYKIMDNSESIQPLGRSCAGVLGIVLISLASQTGHAQFVNKGNVKVSTGTILSVYENYKNEDSGNFVNDGQVHVFQDWENNGTVTYSGDSSKGKTFFTGVSEQIIEGTQVSDFQNILFENSKSAVPFNLAGTISVGNKAEFKKGVVNADPYGGKVIFKENAVHSNVSDASFVDGKVEKQGDKAFQFPVGDELHFRPSYHQAGTSKDNVYTTQYFYKNSDDQYSHSSKEADILFINDKEYWSVTKDKGAENIVLSLTMAGSTTPPDFFSPSAGTQVAIVRWDETQKKWINEGGAVSEPASGEPYANLLTSKVSGYGIFTMALVKTVLPPVPDSVIVYNALSPNGDGINDTFLIKGIDQYPDNEVEIYNRWGVKVFGTKSYNENDNMFKGYSDGRATVNRGEKLPTGTYFYILKYNNGTKGIEKSGYLYISNQ